MRLCTAVIVVTAAQSGMSISLVESSRDSLCNDPNQESLGLEQGNSDFIESTWRRKKRELEKKEKAVDTNHPANVSTEDSSMLSFASFFVASSY